MCEKIPYEVWLNDKINENAYRWCRTKRTQHRGLIHSIRFSGLKKSLMKEGVSRFWESEDGKEKSERKVTPSGKTWEKWVRLCRNSVR